MACQWEAQGGNRQGRRWMLEDTDKLVLTSTESYA